MCDLVIVEVVFFVGEPGENSVKACARATALATLDPGKEAPSPAREAPS
jgi:hypothetical protein